ncbi:MAG: ScpA family protein [Acidobacteria bacterium]|nr:ScpA family protein [Acidobacteriota bacterium]
MRAVLYQPETELGTPGQGFRIRFDGGEGSPAEAGFDGPLELLLRMVREGRADPLRIEIASITRQYLETLELLEILDLRVGSECLKMATALLRIKARRLLPRPVPAGAGTEADPLADLEDRLRDYARYRDAARKLKESLEARRSVWVREPALGLVESEAANGDSMSAEPETLLQVDLFAVVEAFRRVVVRARARPRVPLPERRISMAVLIRRIETAVPPGAEQDFEELLFEVIEGSVDRGTLVAAFLAILELARRRRISVGQDENFGPIRIAGLAPA